LDSPAAAAMFPPERTPRPSLIAYSTTSATPLLGNEKRRVGSHVATADNSALSHVLYLLGANIQTGYCLLHSAAVLLIPPAPRISLGIKVLEEISI
jgi:hypothetical protein